MIVEIHNKLGRPQRVEATRLVISDPIEGVVAVAIEVSERHYYIVHRGDGDDEINRAVRMMGIDQTVISDNVDTPLPKPPGKLWKPGE